MDEDRGLDKVVWTLLYSSQCPSLSYVQICELMDEDRGSDETVWTLLHARQVHSRHALHSQLKRENIQN